MADAVLLVQKRADWVRAEDAAGLADKLGRLALALVQASSYIARTKISVTEYLSRLERYNAEVLTRFPPDDYPDTVKTTWSMSVSQAEREVPGCRQLLAMCAYLGPDRIPRTLFPDHAGLLPAQLRALVTKRLAYDDALGELSGYSMITMDAESMSIHRMVQYATRAQMPLRQQRAWASGAVRLLDEAFPADPRPADMWPVCKQLVPHVQAAARYAQDLAVEEERAGRILHQAGDYLTERAEYGQALGYLTSAQRIRERQGDLGGLAETLARMSFAHYCRAELGMAEETIAVAAELRERVLGPHHPLFAGDLTHYGRVVQELARIGEAIEHMTKAVAILETAYGPDDPGICETLDYLGVAQWRNGNLKAARSTLERAVRIRFEEFGNSRPETAYSRRMLAMIALAQRDLGVAHTEVDQAIETFTTTYGWDYVEALTARQIHGDILLAEGEVKAALDELRAVLAARISLLGDDHPSVAGSRRRVGAALRELGQQAEALAELEAARKVFQDKYGTNHPYVAEVLVELGPVLHRLHRDQEAAECLNRAEVIVEQAYGPDHPALIAILENQAQLSRRDRDRLASRADRIRRVSGVMGDGKAS
jgi:tetratricopeptide (TPR) repeat protein